MWLKFSHPLQFYILKGSFFGGLGVLLPSIVILFYIEAISRDLEAKQLSIFYFCYSILLLLSLVDFGIGFKFLMGRWCLKCLLLRGIISLVFILLTVYFLKNYIQIEYGVAVSFSYLFITAVALWLGHFLKYMFDRVKLFFWGSFIQALPSLLFFKSQIDQNNYSLFNGGNIFLCFEFYLVMCQVILIVSLLICFKFRSTDDSVTFLSEISYSGTLLLALFTVRFDRLWLTGIADQGDLAIYYTISEVCMRLGFLGALISRVAIPYMSEAPSKLNRLGWFLVIRVMLLSFILFLPIMFFVAYIYLPQHVGLNVYYTSMVSAGAMACLLIGQIYFTLLVISKLTVYIVLSQFITIISYVIVVSVLSLDYHLLLFIWWCRIAFEMLLLMTFYNFYSLRETK